MLTIAKILIILTLITPLLIGSLFKSISSFVPSMSDSFNIIDRFDSNTINITSGIWSILIFIASIFLLMYITSI